MNTQTKSLTRANSISARWTSSHPNLMTIKRAHWRSGTSKPLRPGVYEREFKGGFIQFSKWTGTYWCQGDENFARAAWRVEKSAHQNRPWRGVVKG